MTRERTRARVRIVAVIAAAALWAGCRAAPAATAPTTQEAAGGGAGSALNVPAGLTLRSTEDHAVGMRLRFPLALGLSEFELQDGLSPDQLKTVTLVPTLELVVPLGEEWTLLPYAGFGAAWLLDEDTSIGIVSTGARAELWHPFAERWLLGFFPGARYDINVTRRDGLVGDWGRLELPVELRRSFGRPVASSEDEDPRFQPGLYLQGFHYWDPVELQVPGVAPATLDDELELGFSLGSDPPLRLFGWALPRVYVGLSVGDGLRGLRLRFGQI